jgi:hypothetical protein
MSSWSEEEESRGGTVVGKLFSSGKDDKLRA